MPSWLRMMFGMEKFFQGPGAVWKTCMAMVQSLMGMTPDTFSDNAWTYVTDTLYPWFLSIGVILLNIFCLVGFIRQASNLKENVTMEMWIELFIKTIIANFLMQEGLKIIG